MLLADERARRAQQQAENVRRRHNYVPFIVELLRCLAEDGKLVPLVQQVSEKRAFAIKQIFDAGARKPKGQEADDDRRQRRCEKRKLKFV
ncbi:unnamed protein product [Sphagnum balticum]